MEIVVETMAGHGIPVGIRETDTIGELKTRIWSLTKIAPRYQGLILGNHSLSSDETTVGDCGLRDGSRLRLVLLTRSGSLLDFSATTAAASKNLGTHSSYRTGLLQQESLDDILCTNYAVAGAGATSKVQQSVKRSRTRNAAGTTSGEEDSSTAFLDMTFTEEAKRIAKQKADENLKTMIRMRELRQNLDRAGRHRDKNVEDQPGCSSSFTPAPAVYDHYSRFHTSRLLLSAPEDTSAKESSAGETEYEDYRPLSTVLLRACSPSRLRYAGTDGATTTSKATTVAGGGRVAPYQQQHHYRSPIPRMPPAALRVHRSGGCAAALRVVSSSSEPESSADVAIWTTGSEVDDDDDALFTAEEHFGNNVTVGSDGEYQPGTVHKDELFFSGDDAGSPPTIVHIPPQHRVAAPDTSDPSELSSGMILCDLTNEFRRLKVKRRHHVPLWRTKLDDQKVGNSGGTSGALMAHQQQTKQRGNKLVGNARPRSKPRIGLPVAVPPFHLQHNTNTTALIPSSTTPSSATIPMSSGKPKQRVSTTGESSSDDASNSKDVGASTAAVGSRHAAAAASNTNTQYGMGVIRKQLSGCSGSRPAKHRVEKNEVVGIPLRSKLPHSSQSQQRCTTCGCKLVITATFQCRCGKTLCAKHRTGESHQCSRLDNSYKECRPNATTIRPPKMADASD